MNTDLLCDHACYCILTLTLKSRFVGQGLVAHKACGSIAKGNGNKLMSSLSFGILLFMLEVE